MLYIKLNDDMNLVVTKYETIRRGDNLSKKIIFLIPRVVGNIEIDKATVYLNYIRPDSTPDIIELQKIKELYNETYYQYTFPVATKLTKCAGEAVIWLHFFTGYTAYPTTAKSGECVLRIQDSKNMDDYLCDHQITAIWQLQNGSGGSSGDEGDSEWEDMGGEELDDFSGDSEYEWEEF